ncbi:glycoside hydrolase family 28 protein [Flavobacterium agrisoli]|uniref:Glycoside hydrolase family 28 protein n=1 Tax=Flavobacterium agrisoli TaxID=2793066 RepID=A0A934UIV8_9FLAO|nr:glycoside hydrolase family 28 protein [Flavobacterium agrisoli]MBK0369257.1 glycoside hydrolase family 28 protein [Flavobacterium agrisoli]
MKKFFGFFSIVLVISCFFSFTEKDNEIALTEVKVTAPFEMPSIYIPNFQNAKKFVITKFGAKKEDKVATSEAIAKAIDAANKNGGGIVVIPKGEWLTGKVHLKSNVNLHLEKDAILLFSDDPKDYLPAVRSTWEGYECYNYSPLIYAYNCKKVAITGEGELKAKMDVWKTWFTRPKPHMENLKRLYYSASYQKPVEERQMVNDTANLRPHFIQFNRCENVLLEGVKITNSPFWTIHPFLSKNVVIRNIQVYAHGHNNDGVDPEMSQNVLIENCFFDQGDDAIAIKSGCGIDAWNLNTPSKNIVIRNVTVKNGHQLLALGSELSGGIENVFLDNCQVLEGAKLFHLLFIKTNERRGGYVKNIYTSNITSGKIGQGVLGIETDVLYQWRDLVPTIDRKLTPIENIYLEDYNVKEVKFIARILGQKELPVKDVFLKNIKTEKVTEQKYITENVTNFSDKE